MRPTVGRQVYYYMGDQPMAATITRVVTKPMPDEFRDRELANPLAAPEQNWLNLETSHDVWLAVLVHEAAYAGVEFSPEPMPFAEAPTHHHWSWPPRV